MHRCCSLLLLLFAPVLLAQNTEDTSPASLLAAASKTNTLLSPDLHPWHLRAAYQVFNEDGKGGEQGIYEEFYAGARKDKVSYASPGFTQTDYLLETGHLRTGNPRWAGLAEQLVRHNLVHPMPNPRILAGAVLATGQVELAGKSFSCVAIAVPPAEKEPPAQLPAQPSYCFHGQEGEARSALRFASSAGHAYETTYDGPFYFEGHTVARDIHVQHAGRPFLAIHLETLEPLTEQEEGLFTPPPDAGKPPPQRIRISAALAQAYLREGATPSYPLLSEHAGIQGVVVIEALIGVTGRVLQTTVVSTPSKDLAASAIDAIRQWTYRPYVLNGEPAEMVAEIKMQFHLPKR